MPLYQEFVHLLPIRFYLLIPGWVEMVLIHRVTTSLPEMQSRWSTPHPPIQVPIEQSDLTARTFPCQGFSCRTTRLSCAMLARLAHIQVTLNFSHLEFVGTFFPRLDIPFCAYDPTASSQKGAGGRYTCFSTQITFSVAWQLPGAKLTAATNLPHVPTMTLPCPS